MTFEAEEMSASDEADDDGPASFENYLQSILAVKNVQISIQDEDSDAEFYNEARD